MVEYLQLVLKLKSKSPDATSSGSPNWKTITPTHSPIWGQARSSSSDVKSPSSTSPIRVSSNQPKSPYASIPHRVEGPHHRLPERRNTSRRQGRGTKATTLGQQVHTPRGYPIQEILLQSILTRIEMSQSRQSLKSNAGNPRR